MKSIFATANKDVKDIHGNLFLLNCLSDLFFAELKGMKEFTDGEAPFRTKVESMILEKKKEIEKNVGK